MPTNWKCSCPSDGNNSDSEANNAPRSNKKSKTSPSSSPGKAPKSSPSKKSSTSSPKKPSAHDPFHVRKKQLNACIEVHVHLLSGCFKSDALPTLPSPEEIEALEHKFTNNPDPYKVLDENMQVINPNDREVQKRLRKLREDVFMSGGSTYGGKIAHIPQHSIRIILGMVKASGLKNWKPDILSGPDTLYNQLHQQVFNKTFEATVVNFGYRHLQVAFHHLENAHLIDKLYNNYLFSYWRSMLRRETKERGSVEKALARNKVYKRREACCKLRRDFHVKQAWPTRTQRLISEPSCHSDDEDAPDGNYHILVMLRRSTKATAFVRGVDDFIETSQKLLKRRNAYKRIPRIMHPDKKLSQLEGLPSHKVALDWHDPTEFNKLPAYIRARYVNSPIALPLETVINHSDDWKDLKMSDEDFMQKYGNAVRSQYNFPTDEEIYAMEHGAINDSDDSDEEDLEHTADKEDLDDDDDDEEMDNGEQPAGHGEQESEHDFDEDAHDDDSDVMEE
ncbi:hypothetical protein BT96DRAFT_1005010 [Gymnopus androsaceus JB14]|uniref:Uncharacterized protein n=1 Tax=Gymnopus androsaceus JB14 TaxID=1447944 RepID=A0A6A4GQP5_9AGAR|nr:hypothetical protein BT96DRAFT_1005010 [Gymnopus androsaceus JB14]